MIIKRCVDRWLLATLSMALVACFVECGAAQVVQLPSVGVTSVATTVSVPDGGSAYFGGIGRSSSGSTSRGIGPGRLLGSRAIGSAASAGGITAHATILDMAELDEAVLAEGRARHALAGGAASVTGPATAQRAAFIDRHVARRAGTTAGGVRSRSSVAQGIDSSSDAPDHNSAQNSAALSLIADAERAIATGRTSAAEVYYEMAGERASGALRRDIQSRLGILRGDIQPAVGARVASRAR